MTMSKYLHCPRPNICGSFPKNRRLQWRSFLETDIRYSLETFKKLTQHYFDIKDGCINLGFHIPSQK